MKTIIATLALLSVLGSSTAVLTGCFGGPQKNNVCVKDNGDGTSTTCIKATGKCQTAPNENGRKLLNIEGIEAQEEAAFEFINQGGRALLAAGGAPAGCKSGSSWDGGSVCTKDNGDGTTSTCTTGQYYNGCSTYPTPKTGRRALLAAPAGCKSGSTWEGGSVCTKDNGDGTTSTCVTGQYYNGCTTYPSPKTGRRALLAVPPGCKSGSTWDGGSFCIKDNGDGTTSSCTTGKYYNGCSTYPTPKTG